MFKLAIFDLDGTLLNTIDDIAVAVNYALCLNGFPEHPVDEFREFIGHGPEHLIFYSLPEEYRDNETVRDTKAKYAEYYTLHSRGFTKPYDGVMEVLSEINRADTKIAVYSNKPHDNTVCLCDIYFPGLVDMPVGLSEGGRPKPDLTAGLSIMEYFGASPENTVYVGDSGVDMQTGKGLGAYTVGVSWGFRPRNELEINHADVIIDKPCELLKIIVDKVI